jgi:hypothetical protein
MRIDFLELEAAGLTEAEFRGGDARRRTYFPWEIPATHKNALSPTLEAGRFDPEKKVFAQEEVNRPGFRLTQ